MFKIDYKYREEPNLDKSFVTKMEAEYFMKQMRTRGFDCIMTEMVQLVLEQDGLKVTVEIGAPSLKGVGVINYGNTLYVRRELNHFVAAKGIAIKVERGTTFVSYDPLVRI